MSAGSRTIAPEFLRARFIQPDTRMARGRRDGGRMSGKIGGGAQVNLRTLPSLIAVIEESGKSAKRMAIHAFTDQVDHAGSGEAGVPR